VCPDYGMSGSVRDFFNVCTAVDACDCIEYLDIWTIMAGRLEGGSCGQFLRQAVPVGYGVLCGKYKQAKNVRFAVGHRITELRAGLSVLTVVYMHIIYAVNATMIRPWWYPENDGEPAASGL